ncbi:MAG: SGNH/GDSL hydrolase family protein [Clostridia bacterium]|nr:SGNH/GDSL hydrolase family protein [Clostridia bacterium]
MKKILLLLLVLLLSMSFMLVGCDEGEVPADSNPDENTNPDEDSNPDEDNDPDGDSTPGGEDETPVEASFAFGDITMRVGESIPLITVLKDGNANRTLTYTAGGSQVSVSGGKLTAKAVTGGVTVSVSTTGFSASFTVKVLAAATTTPEAPNYGQMTITHPKKIYTNYSGGEVVASFSNPDYATGVVYSSDTDGVYVQNGKVTARGVFHRDTVATITAKSEYHTATFKVTVSTYTSRSAETKVGYYEREKIKPENQGGMIFVGDSYFDGYLGDDGKPPFWKEFATDFAGANAHLFGLSGSEIADLEMVSERVVYPMKPTEIVVHIGFNDVHGLNQTLSDSEAFAKVDAIASRIQALLNEYKEKLPDVHVYYLGVEGKRSASSTQQGTASAHYNSTFKYAPRLSDKMKAFANGKDWCTFIDTGALTYNSGRTDIVTTYYGDNSHLSVAGYQQLTKLLNNERAKRPVVPVVNDFSIANSSTSIQNTAHYIKYMGSNLTTDYVLEGEISVTDFTKNNSHIQLRFSQNWRFLLWDSNSDGTVGVGWTENGTNTNELNSGVSKNYKLADKPKIKFTVAVTNNDAYLYLDGTLVKKFSNVSSSSLEYFNIGAQNVGISVKNMTLTVKKYSATDYSAKLSSLGITY